MPAEVVRVVAETQAKRPRVAFRFLDLDERDRSALLRWIYREQTRRRQ